MLLYDFTEIFEIFPFATCGQVMPFFQVEIATCWVKFKLKSMDEAVV